MPSRVAHSPKHFQDAVKSGVRVKPDGTVELGGVNLFGNPGWAELDDDGNPEGFTLIPFPTPLWWHVYTLRGRQNVYPIPIAQSTYVHDTAISTGYVEPQVGSTQALNPVPPRPVAPSVSAVATTGLRFATGYYNGALAWMDEDMAFGDFSARVALQLTAVGRIEFSGLPEAVEIPSEAAYLGVLLTASQTSSGDATSATLTLQRVLPLTTLAGGSVTLSAPHQTHTTATATADIDAPDAPTLAVGDAFAEDLAGTHKVSVTLDYGVNLETQASPRTNVTLTSPQTLSVTRPTPPNGTCELVDLADVDRPAALAGLDVMFIEYDTPVGTPQGYRVHSPIQAVVAPGEQYTLSQHVKTEDVTEAEISAYLFRDELGEALTDLVPLTTLTGDNAWSRPSDTFTAPDDAVVLEIYGCNVGEGIITLAPPQLEEGAAATTFDPDDGEEGYVIKTFSTLYADGETPTPITRLQRPSGAVPLTVVSEGEDYELSFNSAPTDVVPETGWVTDPDDIDFDNYIFVRVDMEAP